MGYRGIGGFNAWFQSLLSGMLANWLVGLAALFATMGRTVVDKFVPVFLAVSLSGAAGFQHSPANMAGLHWALARASGLDGAAPSGWNITPAACGNVFGGFLLVVVSLWVVFGSKHNAIIHDGHSGEDS